MAEDSMPGLQTSRTPYRTFPERGEIRLRRPAPGAALNSAGEPYLAHRLQR